ncbi:ATP-binding cassette domain-containing protein [Paeniglutamicibacter sp. NPDC012692]|uniref:ATP-binding cassette domain-containing protein n=1 Tax=Paeniglutamicibacter sp. NPDC012692 TaxID=3364388 RepID=UPI0036C0E7E4
MSHGPGLRIEDIAFSHPPANPRGRDRAGTTRLLDGVSLNVPAGELVALNAPSGAGKSTLLRIAAFMLPAASGTVVINGTGFGPGDRVPAATRRDIGVVLQSPRAAADPRLRLDALICSPLSFRDGFIRPRPKRHAGRLAELAELVQLDPWLLRRFPHQVSDGQLQRAMVARALALDPSVLICDEPTAQLDARTTRAVLDVLAGRAAAGAAVLLASHDRAAAARVATSEVSLGDINAAAGAA